MISFLRSVVFVKPISALDTGSAMILLCLGKESSFPLPFLLRSLPLSQSLCLSLIKPLTKGRISEFSGNLLPLGSQGNSTGHPDSGKRGGELSLSNFSSSIHSLLLWVVARVDGRNCFPGFRPQRDDCDDCDVVTMVEVLVQVRSKKPSESFLFSPGASFPIECSKAVTFLDLKWLVPSQ